MLTLGAKGGATYVSEPGGHMRDYHTSNEVSMVPAEMATFLVAGIIVTAILVRLWVKVIKDITYLPGLMCVFRFTQHFSCVPLISPLPRPAHTRICTPDMTE